uniref:Uncharacterized protein n=1 Tax=Moniliophthora roreri TaxID=221103 RepID=A0A0W0GC58_MONRR
MVSPTSTPGTDPADVPLIRSRSISKEATPQPVRPSSSPKPPAEQQQSDENPNPRKRKTPPPPTSDDDDADADADEDAEGDADVDMESDNVNNKGPGGAQDSECQSGYIKCGMCHQNVSFRDPKTGQMCLDDWNAHKKEW